MVKPLLLLAVVLVTGLFVAAPSAASGPRDPQGHELKNIELALEFLRSHGDSSIADGLQELLKAGKIKVDPGRADPEVSPIGTVIYLPPMKVGFKEWDPELEFFNVIDLARSLVHEYIHTQQSRTFRAVSKTEYFWYGLNRCEIEAWVKTFNSIIRWFKQERAEYEAYCEQNPTDTPQVVKEKLRRTGRLRDLISDAVDILDTFYQKKAYSNVSRDAEMIKERLDEWKRTKEIVFELHKDHAETKRAQDFYASIRSDLLKMEQETEDFLGRLEEDLAAAAAGLTDFFRRSFAPFAELFAAALEADTHVEVSLTPDLSNPEESPLAFCLSYQGGELLDVQERACEARDYAVALSESILRELNDAGEPISAWQALLVDGTVLVDPLPADIVLSPRPVILSIDFPSRVPADGSDVSGEVRFRDPDGDIQWAYFDVVEATDFTPFHFDPTESLVAGDAKAGAFRFYVWLNTPQRVTLRVTLVDRAGNASEPVEFTFEGR